MLLQWIKGVVRRYGAWYVLFLCMLLACQRVESGPSLPTPLPTKPFLPYVHPEPSSTISSEVYFSGVGSNILETTNAICVELAGHELIEDGDTGLGWKNYLERSELLVDGISFANIVEPDSYIGSLSEVTYTYLDPDTGELVEGSYAPGPFTFCWEVELGKGAHTIEFRTRKTSGKTLSYRWNFYIND